jgi:hypothetical protein
MEHPGNEPDAQVEEAGTPPGAVIGEFDGFDEEGNAIEVNGDEDPLAAIPADETLLLPGEPVGSVSVGVLGGAPGELEGEDEEERELELDLDGTLGFDDEELEREAALEDIEDGDELEPDESEPDEPDDFEVVGTAPDEAEPAAEPEPDTAAPAPEEPVTAAAAAEPAIAVAAGPTAPPVPAVAPGAVVLADQPSAKPTRKVVAGGIGGLIAALIPVILGLGDVVQFDDPAAQAALASIVTALGGFAAAYFTKDRAGGGTGA